MTADTGIAMRYESLVDTDDALNGMMLRLQQILDNSSLTQDAFVEIAAIYNNVAYVFLYLESNEMHIDYRSVLPWRDAFYKNTALDRRILDAIAQLRCADADAEESRRAYVAYLEDKLRRPDAAAEEAIDALQSEAKNTLTDTERQQRELLARLGVSTAAGRSAATFYKVVSKTVSVATRTRLNQAWRRLRDQNVPALVELVDRMVEIRRLSATEHGYDSVLAHTLTRCCVGEETIAVYLDRYLTCALRSDAGLRAEINETLGTSGDAMDHFGYYVRTLLGGGHVPTFELEECLAFISYAAKHTFGLTLTRKPATSAHVITVDAEVDGQYVGQIKFDLWDNASRPRKANTTKGMRNRTNWANLVQQPVAYVSCRFRRADHDDTCRINFQNAHSLFHEFGHAVNHLLIRKRLPNQSGLEYLPLERLENLSMWFEKWVYHPQLAEHLSLNNEEAEGLARAQRVKMLEYRRTHVERAVTAALDFDVHRRPDGGLRESFASLDERFEISRYCSLGDFPVYFTWPMFQANPGANFVYLWGAADSADKFAPFRDRRIEDSPAPAEVRTLFSACFEFDLPSDEPQVDSVFQFYDDNCPVVLTRPTGP